MKNRNLFMGSISAFAGILLVILLLINLFVVQDDFLKYTNHKYHVEKNLSMSTEALDRVTEQMVAYVKSAVDSPQIIVEINGKDTEFFNQKEIGHLLDVRELISKLYITMLCMCIVCVIGMGNLIRKKAYDAVVNGIIFAWGILVFIVAGIGIAALVDINLVIDGFHEMFLGDSTWVLNPSLDRSVWMFMTNMYEDVLIVIGGIVGAVALISIGTAVIAKKRIKEDKKRGK